MDRNTTLEAFAAQNAGTDNITVTRDTAGNVTQIEEYIDLAGGRDASTESRILEDFPSHLVSDDFDGDGWTFTVSKPSDWERANLGQTVEVMAS